MINWPVAIVTGGLMAAGYAYDAKVRRDNPMPTEDEWRWMWAIATPRERQAMEQPIDWPTWVSMKDDHEIKRLYRRAKTELAIWRLEQA
jgi:hypothetical protein